VALNSLYCADVLLRNCSLTHWLSQLFFRSESGHNNVDRGSKSANKSSSHVPGILLRNITRHQRCRDV